MERTRRESTTIARVRLALLILTACGFHASHPADGALPDGAALADGACAQLATADLASACAEPGPQSCPSVVACINGCMSIDDTICVANCYGQAKSTLVQNAAMNYVACRNRVLGAGGACFGSCQDNSDIGLARCLACLHVCTYDATCTMSCSCGLCAGEFAACYAER
jgi:hypothetical protein